MDYLTCQSDKSLNFELSGQLFSLSTMAFMKPRGVQGLFLFLVKAFREQRCLVGSLFFIRTAALGNIFEFGLVLHM